jgi:hypothetical protein
MAIPSMYPTADVNVNNSKFYNGGEEKSMHVPSAKRDVVRLAQRDIVVFPGPFVHSQRPVCEDPEQEPDRPSTGRLDAHVRERKREMERNGTHDSPLP